MQGLWKDTRKHMLKDKIKAIHSKFYEDEDSIDVLEYKTKTDITYDSEKYYRVYRNVRQTVGDEKFITSKFDRERLFAYGKPLSENFWNEFGFYRCKRKEAQKIVNGMDRQNLRTFIKNENWDAEIKTHAYSKSIAWMVY